jgi:hypothetical protein
MLDCRRQEVGPVHLASGWLKIALPHWPDMSHRSTIFLNLWDHHPGSKRALFMLLAFVGGILATVGGNPRSVATA